MAAIALILRNLTADNMVRLGEIDKKVKLTSIGKDVYFEYNYIFHDIRPYYEGKTMLFENVDANHMVHDCGDDIDLFIWGVENPIDFYRWQYEERGYKDPNTRKESLKNDKFKQINDKQKKARKERQRRIIESFHKDVKEGKIAL